MGDCSSEESLPLGWAIYMSKRRNIEYYFNSLTGESSWERPTSKSIKNNQVKQVNGIKISKNVNEDKEKSSSSAHTSILLQKVSDKLLDHVAKGSTSHYESSKTCQIKHLPPPTAVVTPVIKKPISDKASPVTNKSSNTLKRTQNGALKRTLTISDISQESKIIKHKHKKKNIKSDKLLDPIILEDKQRVFETGDSTLIPEDQDKDVEDIEMLDISMDLDQLATKTDIDAHAKYYIVVDTNILMNELHLIDELKDTPLDGCGPPHIFIPWVVIEELDRLKGSRNSKQTIRAACDAVRYLNSVLSKHPRFHGQSPKEAEQWAKSYSKVNDDKFLECCMALAEQMDPEKVILLTNDKNLINKALICKINVHNWVSLMEKVKPDVIFNGSKQVHKRKNCESDKSNGTDNTSLVEETTENKALQRERDLCKRDIHTYMSTARQLLKEILARFLKQEMSEAYGPVWHSFGIEMKILKSILDAIKKYWIAVFSLFFNEKDKRNFELLSEKVNRPEGFLGDKEECLIILSTIEDVFLQIKRKNPLYNVPVGKIQDLRVYCLETFSKHNEVEKSIREVEFKDVHGVFEENWGVINQLCGLIMDFCQVPHDFNYEKMSQMPSEMDIRLLMCNLYPAVKELNTKMANMLVYIQNNKTSKAFFRKFANALLQFIPSLQIPYQVSSHPHFTGKALERFCTYPQNREMIEIGQKQIDKFYRKLDEALNILMKTQLQRTNSSPETMLLD